MIKVESQLAKIGLILLSSARFFEKIPKKWYARKSNIEITRGKPYPPFLIIVPSGAPMKNKIIHAKPNENLSCIVITCLFKFCCLYDCIVLLDLTILTVLFIELIAKS